MRSRGSAYGADSLSMLPNTAAAVDGVPPTDTAPVRTTAVDVAGMANVAPARVRTSTWSPMVTRPGTLRAFHVTIDAGPFGRPSLSGTACTGAITMCPLGP